MSRRPMLFLSFFFSSTAYSVVISTDVEGPPRPPSSPPDQPAGGADGYPRAAVYHHPCRLVQRSMSPMTTPISSSTPATWGKSVCSLTMTFMP